MTASHPQADRKVENLNHIGELAIHAMCVSGGKNRNQTNDFPQTEISSSKTSEKCCINKYFTFQCVGSPSSSSVELFPAAHVSTSTQMICVLGPPPRQQGSVFLPQTGDWIIDWISGLTVLAWAKVAQRRRFPSSAHKLTVLLQFLSVLQLWPAALLPVNKKHMRKVTLT